MKSFVNHKLLALVVALTLGLVACVPVQQGVLSFLNAVGGGDDPAVLILESSGVLFASNGQVEGVALLIEGRNLVSGDERCRPIDTGVACILGDVDGSVRVAFESDGGLSASVSFIRGDTIRALIVSEPAVN